MISRVMNEKRGGNVPQRKIRLPAGVQRAAVVNRRVT